jgi:hypothetical protein
MNESLNFLNKIKVQRNHPSIFNSAQSHPAKPSIPGYGWGFLSISGSAASPNKTLKVKSN